MSACDQEMCPMWDGDTCPCERFGLDRDNLMGENDDVGAYRCPFCGYRHVTQTGIDWHVRKHHPEEEQG